MYILIVFSLMALLASSNATARDGVLPDPDMCTVEPCDDFLGVITSPFAQDAPHPPEVIQFKVTVQTAPGIPMPGVFVEIIAARPSNHFFCEHAELTGITDAEGQAFFAIAAGGCTVDDDAVMIRANGVDIRVYRRLLSPDYAGSPSGGVDIADLVTFSQAFTTGSPGCTDYFNDGQTGLDDFLAFAACWGLACE